jgi:hypothetical protein
MSTLGSIFVLLGLVGFIWGIVRLTSATQTSAHQALKLDHTRWWACLIDRWRTAGRYESQHRDHHSKHRQPAKPRRYLPNSSANSRAKKLVGKFYWQRKPRRHLN